jgi:hypothetical protein
MSHPYLIKVSPVAVDVNNSAQLGEDVEFEMSLGDLALANGSLHAWTNVKFLPDEARFDIIKTILPSIGRIISKRRGDDPPTMVYGTTLMHMLTERVVGGQGHRRVRGPKGDGSVLEALEDEVVRAFQSGQKDPLYLMVAMLGAAACDQNFASNIAQVTLQLQHQDFVGDEVEGLQRVTDIGAVFAPVALAKREDAPGTE